MAKTKRSSSSHRKLDLVSDELISVLSRSKSPFEFLTLFDVVHKNLRDRPERSVHGGPTMLRMRVYEKLQILVKKGAVKKTATINRKLYLGVPSKLIELKQESESESPARVNRAD